MLDQPLKIHESPPDYAFEKTAKSYESFAKDLKFPGPCEVRAQLVEEIDKIITEFEGRRTVIDIEDKEPAKIHWIHDSIIEKLKNKIKPVAPFRKRKSTNWEIS